MCRDRFYLNVTAHSDAACCSCVGTATCIYSRSVSVQRIRRATFFYQTVAVALTVSSPPTQNTSQLI